MADPERFVVADEVLEAVNDAMVALHAMEHRFTADVERLIGRRVARFIPAHHVAPTWSSNSSCSNPDSSRRDRAEAAPVGEGLPVRLERGYHLVTGGRSYRGRARERDRQRYVTSDLLHCRAIEESPCRRQSQVLSRHPSH
jgi:hypothetical protein